MVPLRIRALCEKLCVRGVESEGPLGTRVQVNLPWVHIVGVALQKAGFSPEASDDHAHAWWVFHSGLPQSCLRRFWLDLCDDTKAEGVLFPDGQIALVWREPRRKIETWDTLRGLLLDYPEYQLWFDDEVG